MSSNALNRCVRKHLSPHQRMLLPLTQRPPNAVPDYQLASAHPGRFGGKMLEGIHEMRRVSRTRPPPAWQWLVSAGRPVQTLP
jgi:hypothetical protein